nr:hypothetical protein [Tanacetum cinerariifolium]
MSDLEDFTVTYTTVSSPYEGRSEDVSPGVDGPPVMPEDPYAYVVAAFQALPPLDYVPGLEEPEQAPPLPPLPAAASPTAESPGYISEFDSNEDPEEDDDEDPEEDPADYPADHDDDDEEEEPSGDDANKEDEEQDKDDDEEEEEHPSLADSILPPPALRVTARISFRPHPPTLSFTKEDAERFLAMPIPPPSPLTPLLSPLPQIPSPPVLASPPILPRLSIVHCPRYEAAESSVAVAARPIEGRRADYGFVDSVEAEIRRRRAEDIGYGIRDTWIDPRDVAEEEALTNLEGVNTRVTEHAAVQEQDTQDIYGVTEDTHGRQTKIFQRVEALVEDSQYPYKTGRLETDTIKTGQIGAKTDKTGQKREAWRSREKLKVVAVGRGRKTKENAKRMIENAYTETDTIKTGQIGANLSKTGQKREAWRSRKKSRAVAVERGRKTEENKKRMAENEYTD